MGTHSLGGDMQSRARECWMLLGEYRRRVVHCARGKNCAG